VPEKASLEKITYYAVFTAQTNPYVPKKFFSQEVFWAPFFQKRCENKYDKKLTKRRIYAQKRKIKA
jgi:hypothetical protein